MRIQAENCGQNAGGVMESIRAIGMVVEWSQRIGRRSCRWLGWTVGVGTVAWVLWGSPLSAYAHGVDLEYKTVEAIQIQATYDSGEPMTQASVNVYSPTDPATPWQQGMTDDQGRFSFVPDPSLPGRWEVIVRQAGHGSVVTIPVEDPATEGAATDVDPENPANPMAEDPEVSPRDPGAGTGSTSSAESGGSLQTVVTAAAVIWGLIGTALFFSRRNSGADQDQ